MRFTTVCLLALAFCACGTLDRVIHAQEVKEKKEEKKRIGGWELQEVAFAPNVKVCSTSYSLKNITDKPQRLPKSVKDLSYRSGKQDLRHAASAFSLTDINGDTCHSFWVTSSVDSGEIVKPGQTGIMFVHFPPVALSPEYKLQFPGEALGAKGVQTLQLDIKSINIVSLKAK